ncbi:uncharacterized protein B0H64DRAFT_404901 [Chaetomium fimeti]|uniref:Transmembrane protein n=1 Tax=Chaetomium fimeti TaxID=1854472 RepID=A0AAE0LQB2_9PEZI|nr:hypothetical protein B0H64DRAFT_404901 [Chaetomium fimeti]
MEGSGRRVGGWMDGWTPAVVGIYFVVFTFASTLSGLFVTLRYIPPWLASGSWMDAWPLWHLPTFSVLFASFLLLFACLPAMYAPVYAHNSLALYLFLFCLIVLIRAVVTCSGARWVLYIFVCTVDRGEESSLILGGGG